MVLPRRVDQVETAITVEVKCLELPKRRGRDRHRSRLTQLTLCPSHLIDLAFFFRRPARDQGLLEARPDDQIGCTREDREISGMVLQRTSMYTIRICLGSTNIIVRPDDSFYSCRVVTTVLEDIVHVLLDVKLEAKNLRLLDHSFRPVLESFVDAQA